MIAVYGQGVWISKPMNERANLEVDVGMRQVCVIFPWLFDIYMGGVINLPTLGKFSNVVTIMQVSFFVFRLLGIFHLLCVLTHCYQVCDTPKGCFSVGDS